jgi:hypothetical protein
MSQAIRILLYAVLVVSAGASFLLGDRLWHAAQVGTLPRWAALAPACAFTLFVVIYTIDRLLLVTRRRYPTGRAFFQIAFAVLFLGLLWPTEVSRLQESRRRATQPDAVLRLLGHRDDDVRAAACELLAWRGDTEAAPALEKLAAKDPSAEVRAACARAVAGLHAEPPPVD